MAELAVVLAYAVGTAGYALILGANEALKKRRARLQGTHYGETGVKVVLVSPKLEEVESLAAQMQEEGKDVAIIKVEQIPLMERIKSGANDYTALQKRVGTNEIGTENQKHRNAYQNNLMEAAYGEASENNIYGNLEGGRRSKRLTKRRRNGRKSSRR